MANKNKKQHLAQVASRLSVSVTTKKNNSPQICFFWSVDEKFCHRHYQSLSVLLVSVSNSKQYRFCTKTKISTSFFSSGVRRDTRQKIWWGEKKTRVEPNFLVNIRKKKNFLDLHLKTKEVLENKLLFVFLDT